MHSWTSSTGTGTGTTTPVPADETRPTAHLPGHRRSRTDTNHLGDGSTSTTEDRLRKASDSESRSDNWTLVDRGRTLLQTGVLCGSGLTTRRSWGRGPRTSTGPRGRHYAGTWTGAGCTTRPSTSHPASTGAGSRGRSRPRAPATPASGRRHARCSATTR